MRRSVDMGESMAYLFVIVRGGLVAKGEMPEAIMSAGKI
jgi:hypothetical protein